MTKVLRQFRTEQDQEKVLLFYLERVMEQIESGCILLANDTFRRYRNQFGALLKPAHLARLDQVTSQDSNWSAETERVFIERMKNAWEFGEYKTVHDACKEILLHIKTPSNGHTQIAEQVRELLAANNFFYIEPDSININTFIDANVVFIVEKRKAHNQTQRLLRGNPGFYLEDALGNRYRCFVKQVDDVGVGERLKLKITNIPGIAFATQTMQEPIIYLEPRVSPGDTIEIELGTLSHTENSFTFRHHSYDGFLWFKRRGVNKNLFNQDTLQEGDRIVARVLYTTEEEKRSPSGNITRLGIIKAIPVRKAALESNPEADPDTGAAKALN